MVGRTEIITSIIVVSPIRRFQGAIRRLVSDSVPFFVKTIKYLLTIGSERSSLTESAEMCPSRVNPKTATTAR